MGGGARIWQKSHYCKRKISFLIRREEEERLRREEEERERKKRQAEEAEAKARQEAVRKEKEAQRKTLKQKRKKLRTLCRDNDFFAESEDEKVRNMSEVDRLCELLEAEELDVLNGELQTEGRAALLRSISMVNSRLEKEKMEMIETAAKSGGSGGDKSSASGSPWSADEIALLIKAVNLFPAGKEEKEKGRTNLLTKTIRPVSILYYCILKI